MSEINIWGLSRVHEDLLKELANLAPTDAEVLITGPSGVGKELYARYVHEKSRRARRAFVAVNCGALPNELIENELFGHRQGAFTGARTQSKGLVAEAEGGTIFLDEVDTFSLINQVKLLRFLQEKEYRPLGETRVRKANVRVIAASNTNLEEATRLSKFRQDLFFRLQVAHFKIPPLHERKEDIPILFFKYMHMYAEKYERPHIELAEGTLEYLENYSWPGNVRELINCVQRLILSNINRPARPQDLKLLNWDNELQERENFLPFGQAKQKVVRDFEQQYLDLTLRQTKGNIAKAAQMSAKPRRAYFELMRKNNVSASVYRETKGTGKDNKQSNQEEDVK